MINERRRRRRRDLTDKRPLCSEQVLKYSFRKRHSGPSLSRPLQTQQLSRLPYPTAYRASVSYYRLRDGIRVFNRFSAIRQSCPDSVWFDFFGKYR